MSSLQTSECTVNSQVMDFLGSAAFSRAVQALDVKTRRLVCLKIIKNNKDYFDQSLDEIKLLSYINSADPMDEHGLLRLYDYFYYKVCLLDPNASIPGLLLKGPLDNDPARHTPTDVVCLMKEAP